jgi:hypothetical protein
VTVVSALAGSGKTVLLRSWIAEAALADRAGWVVIGRDERGPLQFWLSVLREQLWLVIDDLHELGSDQARRQLELLTRSRPPGWTGYSGRVDAALPAKIAWRASEHPLAFVCGPTSFVEAVAGNLVALRYPRAGSRPNGSEVPDGRTRWQFDRRPADRGIRDGHDRRADDLRDVRCCRGGRGNSRLPARARDRGALPHLRQRAHGHRADPGHALR